MRVRGLKGRPSTAVPAGILRQVTYPRNPNFFDPKFAKFGKTAVSAESGTPNHDASVAPY